MLTEAFGRRCQEGHQQTASSHREEGRQGNSDVSTPSTELFPELRRRRWSLLINYCHFVFHVFCSAGDGVRLWQLRSLHWRLQAERRHQGLTVQVSWCRGFGYVDIQMPLKCCLFFFFFLPGTSSTSTAWTPGCKTTAPAPCAKWTSLKL